jgi:tetratricopeptide (TPR) repeat protein
MTKIICQNSWIFLSILILATSNFAQSQTSNSISGFVFDAVDRNPISDVYVELLDDVYMTLKRVRTDGSGRYFFSGISSGNFKVKVSPYGTNYLEEIQEATIINYSFGNSRTSDNVYLDIYLKLDKRKINIGGTDSTTVIFIQDVPLQARNFYKKGESQMETKKNVDVGLENIKKALEIFPNYYDALNRIGIEYLKRKEYLKAIPYLIKAVEVNQRSFSSFYALGLAATDLKKLPEAIKAFRATTVINPQSVYAQTKYGMVLRMNGNYKEAEQSLLKALSLDKYSQMAEIHWQLGLLYEKTERYSEAADELEKYIKIQSDASNIQQIKKLIAQLRAKGKK